MSSPVTTAVPAVDPVTVPAVGEDPWVADLDGESAHDNCQSTVGFSNRICDGSPRWYAQLEVWEYDVANPRWEGKLCDPCLAGWREWAAEDPEAIRVVSVNPVITGD